MTACKTIGMVVCLALVACGVCMFQHVATAQPAAAVPPADAKAGVDPQVGDVLKAYTEAFQAKDIEGIMKVFADDPKTTMMGTGEGETWVGKESIRAAHNAFFANIKKETTERKLLSAKQVGDMAWLAGFLVAKQANDAGEHSFQLNISLVMEKKDGEWRIICMHFSRLLLMDRKS